MKVVALAGGIGGGKFLRGLARLVPAPDLTVIVNTADDHRFHGLHVSPDVDSVVYWLGGEFDRERGWGRAGETFRVTRELAEWGAPDAWFGLGDLDLATHLVRTQMLAGGASLSEATAAECHRFGVDVRILPMTDDPVETHIEVVAEGGGPLDLHFQEYWVRRGASDRVSSVRFEGVDRARPAPGALEAIRAADMILLCPSNPVVSIAPILAIDGVRPALQSRRELVGAISPIVGGRPVRGMADKLLPVVGADVSALGVVRYHRDVLGAFVLDQVDRGLAQAASQVIDGRPVVWTDTIMSDDDAAERVAHTAMTAVRANLAHQADSRGESGP